MPTASITGVVERITYHNEENGYTVARVSVVREREPLTILGNFASISAGESLRLWGTWTTHPQYGRQFRVSRSVVEKPATLLGIEKYLGSGLIKGIGPVTARRIVKHFGLATLDIIEQQIDRLIEVRGLGPKRVAAIRKAWAAQRVIKEVMLFLQGHGVTPGFAVKIYKQYGDEAIRIVSEDPYRLARDVYGIGFRTADRLAQSLGIARDAEPRLRASLQHALSEASDDGHCYLPEGILLENAATVLGLAATDPTQPAPDAADRRGGNGAPSPALAPPGPSPEGMGANESSLPLRLRLAECLESLIQNGELYRDPTVGGIVEDPLSLPPRGEKRRASRPAGATRRHPLGPPIYLPAFFQTEEALARALRTLATESVTPADGPALVARIHNWIERYCAAEQVRLSDEQRAAVVLAGTRRLLVLTGGPGVGKTTTTRAIVRLLRAMHLRVLLASPTGRAAQRLAEVTGFPAQTVHRLLAFDPAKRSFSYDHERPLEADAVIVDEASMLDLFLAHGLVKAIGPQTRLILVGDADQLPSVGPGNVLRDLLATDIIPVARLTSVFRQAATSLIITNAHRVNRGEFPRLVAPGTLLADHDLLLPDPGVPLADPDPKEREHATACPSPLLSPKGAETAAREQGPRFDRAVPPPSLPHRSDCTFLEATDPEAAAALLARVATADLPRRLGLHPIRDVQVLCPMNRGELGAHRLNERLQALLNPPGPEKPEVQRYGMTLRVGDKVIQRVNNYTLQVFNGEIGFVTAIDLEEQQVVISFADQRAVVYEYADLNELAHAFAVTIHKAQGSEFPAVVLPIHTQHYPMLSRNLLYTGLTRARRAVVLIGTKKAIALAVRNADVGRRYTALAERLHA